MKSAGILFYHLVTKGVHLECTCNCTCSLPHQMTISHADYQNAKHGVISKSRRAKVAVVSSRIVLEMGKKKERTKDSGSRPRSRVTWYFFFLLSIPYYVLYHMYHLCMRGLPWLVVHDSIPSPVRFPCT
ncbi:hypothetical protein BGZ63DRAFT_391436 [Mariannaea sp. PMI_226]|nr:hypothetical protein BGZ63DRAFT_391436 [Mariannaea sp. PMI_226]